jgi:hypothetical protein
LLLQKTGKAVVGVDKQKSAENKDAGDNKEQRNEAKGA